LVTRPSLRRLLHPVYRSLETRAHLLRYLFLEITRRCNLECLHCGSDCTRAEAPRELTPDEWVSFIGRLAAGYDPRRVLPVITGGEPFCAPGFEAILDALGNHGFAWGMVTNGWALTPANFARARAAGLASLTISLDGMQASHDWLRGRRGAFDRAADAIGLAARAGLPAFDVVTCANPRNLDELPETMSLLHSLGVREWRLFTIFPRGRAKANPELLLDDAALRRLFDWIAQARRDTAGTGFRLQYGCEGYLPAGLDAAVRDEPYFCRAGITIGSVLADGSISACPNLPASLVQGNVRADDFEDVWENRFEAFRDRSWMRTGACKTCGEWSRCQGNSLHLWDDDARSTARCHWGAAHD